MNSPESDSYAAGMISSADRALDVSPNLDRFQYSFFSHYLSGTVMEIGAGPGRMTALALKDPAISQLVVLEPSQHFAGLLRKRFPQEDALEIIQAEASSVRDRFHESLDALFSVDVLEHIENDQEFLRDCLAMVKPGGYLIAVVPALPCLYSTLDRNIGHFRRYNRSMIRRLIKGLPVSLEKMTYLNMIGVFASFFIIKVAGLEFQSSTKKTDTFFFLFRLYSKVVVPIVQAMERLLPVPFGLTLAVVLKKNRSSG